MGKIVDGRAMAEKIKDEIVKEIVKLKTRPNLAIILAGDREDSKLYVDLKEKEAKKVGIDTHTYKCDQGASEDEIIEMIKWLNNDDMIDAILVQLPLPAGFDTDCVIRAIDPEKDVDRFHPANLEILMKTCDHSHVLPPLFQAIFEIFKNIECDIRDKRVGLLVNSEIFGKSLKQALECRGAEVDIVDINDIGAKSREADILITAVGKKHIIKKDMVAEDAVVIDIGIFNEDKRVYGDVDFDEVKDKASFITPVPGGVGPMTIAMLFKNTLELYNQKH